MCVRNTPLATALNSRRRFLFAPRVRAPLLRAPLSLPMQASIASARCDTCLPRAAAAVFFFGGGRAEQRSPDKQPPR